MPDPELLAPLRQELDDASTEAIRSGAALTHAEEQLAAARQETSRAHAAHEAALDKAAHADLAADDSLRMIEHVDRVRTTLGRLRTAAAERHLDRINSWSWGTRASACKAAGNRHHVDTETWRLS
jgi:DNA sulfur modification protein DndD